MILTLTWYELNLFGSSFNAFKVDIPIDYNSRIFSVSRREERWKIFFCNISEISAKIKKPTKH